MSIKINQKKCIGCKGCTQVCPGNLIKMEKNKAKIVYPKLCWGCTACLKECPVEAIEYYLGEDIGGNGGYLYTKNSKESIEWYIVDAKGCQKTIKTYKKQANNY